jgi:hypothetical protein
MCDFSTWMVSWPAGSDGGCILCRLRAADGRRWDAPPKVRFAIDSPLEGEGFEPSVPHEGLPEDQDDGPPFRGGGGGRCPGNQRIRGVDEHKESSYRVRERLDGRRSLSSPGRSTRRRYRPSRSPLRFSGPEEGLFQFRPAARIAVRRRTVAISRLTVCWLNQIYFETRAGPSVWVGPGRPKRGASAVALPSDPSVGRPARRRSARRGSRSLRLHAPAASTPAAAVVHVPVVLRGIRCVLGSG